MDSNGAPLYGADLGSDVQASQIWKANSINASTILDRSETNTIHIVATITSSVSLVAAICAMYWFIIMRRNFRRNLVLMLIAGGFWKSLWFWVFSVATFVRGQVETESPFCQASGYFLQVGFEACDVAVLFMSMHMYFQIFPPARSNLGHDGLYRVRHWVLATWILFPNVNAALAFVNPQAGYMAQGAWCSMPLRPFYYRLGLFWAPRYLIWLYIVFVAVRIYRHVGAEFKIFGQEKASDSSATTSSRSPTGFGSRSEEQHSLRSMRSNQWIPSASPSRRNSVSNMWPPEPTSLNRTLQASPKGTPGVSRRGSIASPQEHPGGRRHSTPNLSSNLHDFGLYAGAAAPRRGSVFLPHRESRQLAPNETIPLPDIPDEEPRRGSVVSISTRKSSLAPSTIPALEPIEEATSTNIDATPISSPRNSANRVIQQRRRAIQRQLRLLFIYPVIYIMLWVIPFVVNIMNYTNYYAQHPIFALQLIQVIMLTGMTHVDVVVFCWREMPWRHIPGSDGTVLGSFMWWRYCSKESWVKGRRSSTALSTVPEDEVEGPAVPEPRPGFWTSLRTSFSQKSTAPSASQVSSSAPGGRTVVRQGRNFSGGNDRNVLQAERAHERLALERADYQQNRQSLQQSLQDARTSVISSTQSPQPARRKEWFDKDMESDLFTDDDCAPDAKKGQV